MKYKVGDKVRVRKDLVPGNYYDGVCYVDYMNGFKGKECIITNMDSISYQIDNFDLWWTDGMFEPIDDLLEYALEKLGIIKEELENEMNRDKEDIAFIEKYRKDKGEMREYCRKFSFSCNGCGVKKFKDKYYGDMECINIFRYLKEKGEI